MELANKTIIVVGLGVTGIAVARFLKKRGAVVIVTDLAAEETLGPRAQKIHEMGIAMELGRHRSQTFENADLVVLSPGVAHTIEPVLRAKEHGIPVIGEVELASWFIQEPILAVTGTNGKTTTSEILGGMLMHSGFNVFVGGNIGNPLIDYVDGEAKGGFHRRGNQQLSTGHHRYFQTENRRAAEHHEWIIWIVIRILTLMPHLKSGFLKISNRATLPF